MNTFSKQLLALATLTALSTPIYAQGFYFGASAGYAQSDEICDTLDDNFGLFDNCDDGKAAWKLSLGYQLTPHWGVEAFYADFGEIADHKSSVTIGAILPTTFSSTADAEVDGYGAAIVGQYPLGDFSVLSKVGIFKWDAEMKGRAGIGLVSIPASTDEDDTDLMFGLGIDYAVTENISLRAEWEYYDDIEVDLFSAGFRYQFF